MKEFIKKNKKKIIIILILILIIAIGLVSILIYLNKRAEDEPTSIISDDEIIETESISEGVDANIIGYLTIESIDLNHAPIAQRNGLRNFKYLYRSFYKFCISRRKCSLSCS